MRARVELSQRIREIEFTEAVKRRLIDEMNNSVRFWLKAAYRQNPPVMAQDRNPAEELRIAVEELAKRWQRNFDLLAPKLGDYFATAVQLRTVLHMLKDV